MTAGGALGEPLLLTPGDLAEALAPGAAAACGGDLGGLELLDVAAAAMRTTGAPKLSVAAAAIPGRTSLIG